MIHQSVLALWMFLLAVGSTPANAAGNLVIDLTYDAVMDMVRPVVRPDIRVHHNLQVTVSAQNTFAEDRNRNTGRYYRDQNSMMQVLGSSGDQSSYASWVASDGRLVRTQNDPQSTRTMTVTLLSGNTCRLDVVDTLKPGFREYAFLRITTHTMGYFSAYRVTATSCAVRRQR